MGMSLYIPPGVIDNVLHPPHHHYLYCVQYLAEVSRVSHHVDVEELGYITCPGVIVIPFERCSDIGTLLVDEVSLILGSLAGSDSSDKVTDTQCRRHCLNTANYTPHTDQQ